jgi:hypothetical protein
MSTVAIFVDGVDITSDVIFSTASFTQQFGGAPGTFSFTVRDPNRTHSFRTGVEMYLEIDGIRMFGGYVRQRSMGHMAPAADTNNVSTYQLRTWTLRGSDYNVIFDVRVARNTADYLTQITLTGTYDGEVLVDLVSNFADCSDFTTSGIQNIEAFPGGANDIIAQGTKLRDEFRSMSYLGSASYYVDGSKNFIFIPYESTVKRWGFSDQPNNAAITTSPNDYQNATHRFREVEATEDGTFIVNDALIWGGSPFAGTAGGTVFSRTQDSTSESTYGRWQLAETHFGERLYSIQEQVDVRSNTIVNGPPGVDPNGLQKGLKYPQWQFTFVWQSVDVPLLSGVPDHLVAGDLVTIVMNTFGVTKLLPLRSLTTTFPDALNTSGNPSDRVVRFSGTFGLQITDPTTLWAFIMSQSRQQANESSATAPAGAVDNSSSTSYYGSLGQFIPSPVTDGTTTVFTIPFAYIAGTTEVYMDGLLQRLGTDYTESDPGSGQITMSSAPRAVDNLIVTCFTTNAIGGSIPGGGGSVTVSSILALKNALADDTIGTITVTNGTYLVDNAFAQTANSLYIGSTYAGRTTSVSVSAETNGGVTFSRGGGAGGSIAFVEGSHHQTWTGFNFANQTINATGVIFFGGVAGVNAPHDITLDHFTVENTCTRVGSGTTDHALYFSYALDTWANINISNYTVDASSTMGLATGVHMDHGYVSDHPNYAAHDVTVTNFHFTGNGTFNGQQAFILWQPPTYNWTLNGATITNSGGYAVRFESIGASSILIENVTSTGSGTAGFYSSLGSYPSSVPGVTFVSDSFG